MDKREQTAHLRRVPDSDRDLADAVWEEAGKLLEASEKQMREIGQGKYTLAEAKVPSRFSYDRVLDKLLKRMR